MKNDSKSYTDVSDLENIHHIYHVHYWRVIRWYANSSAQHCECGSQKLVYTDGIVHEGHLM